jgi:hypothetical protein
VPLGYRRSRLPDHRSGNANHGVSGRLRKLVYPDCGPRREDSPEKHRGGSRLGRNRRGNDLRSTALFTGFARRYAGLSVGQSLLRDRSTVMGGVVAIRSDHAGMVARSGDLRFCPQPYRVRLSEGAPHADSLGGVQRGVGGCRDYAHLAIALCRRVNIPARYCTGYLGDMGRYRLTADGFCSVD